MWERLQDQEVVVGSEPVSVAQIVGVARDDCRVRLSSDEGFGESVRRSREHLRRTLEAGTPIYGVTTGFGGSCGNRVHAARTRQLGRNLLEYHGCGSGEPLSVPQVRAAMFCRLVGLSRGYSGVSWELLEQLVAFLNARITPVVPSRGSVGASGDLTPMSYVAACLAGDREVFFDGVRLPTSDALARTGLAPYEFEPKEPLALLNGTPVMTGIAALAVDAADKIFDAVGAATALSVHALAGHAHHFHAAIFEAKPFLGQEVAAGFIRERLHAEGEVPEINEPDSLQDPYSLRCAPHVLGVLADALDWIQDWVETEASGVSDNPLFDPTTGELLTGGNFYGGHVAFAMDSLKAAVASVADMADRQIALLVDSRFSRGLPNGLVRANGNDREVNHGFKALQITASALTAEALRLTVPAASFSRSTESHNQDKVSMGTIAARDAALICSLTADVAAAHLLTAAQGCELRGALDARPGVADLVRRVRVLVPPTIEDRPMDRDLSRLARALLAGLDTIGLQREE